MNRNVSTAYSARAVALAALISTASLGFAAGAETQARGAAVPVVAPGAPQSFADIIQRVSPAVVSIDVESKADPNTLAMSGQIPAPFRFEFGAPGASGGTDNPFGFDLRKLFPQPDPGDLPRQKAAGSGFFISPDGYIVTNNHVVAGADRITVRTQDGREFKARLIGRDPATDLAVIKVDGEGLAYVNFEDRARPRVGDWVVAVGNPFGLGGTATAGIVSALGRKNVSQSNYVDYMQIDAPINHGNSGGPTFDIYGRVVGVNTAIFSPSGGSVGIGFDIPADVANAVTRQLISSGKVVRGYIGALVQPVTPEIAASLGLGEARGALVAQLTPGGPAELAGLKPGDLILTLNGRDVTSANDLTRQVALARAGEVLRIGVRRDGQLRTVDVRSAVRPSEVAAAGSGGSEGDGAGSASAAVLGMQLEPNAKGGVTIDHVRADSDAAEKGLRAGDVILSAAGRPVGTPTALADAVAQARRSGRKAVLLLVSRNGQHLFVAVDDAPARG